MFGPKVGCEKPRIRPRPTDLWGLQIGPKICLKIFKFLASLRTRLHESDVLKTEKFFL